MSDLERLLGLPADLQQSATFLIETGNRMGGTDGTRLIRAAGALMGAVGLLENTPVVIDARDVLRRVQG